MTTSTFSTMICGKGPSTITRRAAVALVHPSHQLDDSLQSLRHWHIGDLFADTADAVISFAMCSSISWNMAVPQTTRHRVLTQVVKHLDHIVGRADAVVVLRNVLINLLECGRASKIRSASPITRSLPVKAATWSGKKTLHHPSQRTSGWHRTRSSLEANCITNQTVAVREGNITKVNTNFNSITDVNMELNKTKQQKNTTRKFASFEHVCTAHTQVTSV